MTVTVTSLLAIALTLLAVLFGWLGARAADPHRGVRLVPYRFLMVVCAGVDLFMLVHLVNLFGGHTGR